MPHLQDGYGLNLSAIGKSIKENPADVSTMDYPRKGPWLSGSI